MEPNGDGLQAQLLARVVELEGAFSIHMRREHVPLAARLAEIERAQCALVDTLETMGEMIAEHQERLALLQPPVASTGEEGERT